MPSEISAEIESLRPNVNDPRAQEVAEPNIILRGVVGSTVHGVSIGSDDRDEMAIFIPPPDHVLGLEKCEHWVYRTKPEGERSGQGDLDLSAYSLHKYMHLVAEKGNPTVLLLMFVPHRELVVTSWYGSILRKNAGLMRSKRSGRAFLSYMQAQRRALTGEGGGYRSNRPELIEKHGFDAKYAGHIIRLGFQGVEYMENGTISLPMRPHARDRVLAIRRGEVPLGEVISQGRELEERLIALLETPCAPDQPDRDGLNRLMSYIYLRYWRRKGLI